MSDAFISYRRKPSAALAQLIQLKLERDYGIDAYLDTTRTDSTRVKFPERLMKAIEDSPTFICLLGDSTLESDWVRKEIWRAYELGKHCIPVFQESYIPTEDTDEAIDYLLDFDGVHVLDVKNIFVDQTVADLAALIVRAPKKRYLPMLLGGVVTLFVIAGIVGVLLLSGGGGNDNLSSIELAQTETFQTEVAIFSPTTEAPPTATFTDEPISTPTSTLTPTLTEEPPTATPTPTYTDEPTRTPTNTLTPTLTEEPPTITPTPTPTNEPITTLSPLEIAQTGVTQNVDWTPYSEPDASGVEMMLVPGGCFMMGSENGNEDEVPVNEQCFDEPFWVDKYEVTNAQFGSTGCESGSSEPSQPRNCVTWFDALNYCESRGARLPTEREWEYTARGPDNLVYPWGDDFVENNGVYSGNSDNRADQVGSRLGSASWVGAFDMSGNVSEWVSTIYDTYPYDLSDGRENVEDTTSIRVLRGGSFNDISDKLRAATRGGSYPDYGDYVDFYGFRCARDFVDQD